MTGRFPEIPSTTKREQDELREKLIIETRKREMSQQAGLEEEPPRKVWRISPRDGRKNYRCHGRGQPRRPNNNKDNTWCEPILPT